MRKEREEEEEEEEVGAEGGDEHFPREEEEAEEEEEEEEEEPRPTRVERELRMEAAAEEDLQGEDSVCFSFGQTWIFAGLLTQYIYSVKTMI